MIVATELRKCFGDIEAVSGVSFEAKDSRVTGLLGRNGAGKTTTLRMLSGLIRPDGGEAEVDGFRVSQYPLEVRSRMGVLPDSRGLYPRLSAREHLRYFARLQGLSASQAAEREKKWIRRLEMGSIAERRVEGFSQGERTKVALGRAVIHEPQNIILDEPTNGLDVSSTRAMRDVIRGLRDEGRCVIFSSHIMQEVSALCDDILIMAEGKIVASGTAEELLEQAGKESLEESFVVLTGSDES